MLRVEINFGSLFIIKAFVVHFVWRRRFEMNHWRKPQSLYDMAIIAYVTAWAKQLKSL